MFLLLVMPLASYFLSYSLIFTNPSIFTASSARARQAPVYSAIVAILVANGVVFTYVWIAFTEGNTINDDTSSRSVKEETKKKE